MVVDFHGYRRDRMDASVEQYVLPNSIEAEEAVLGGVLIDAYAMDRIGNLLKPEYFYLTEHQAIFQAASDLYYEDQPIDLISVGQKLTDRGVFDRAGGQAKLAYLIEVSIGAVNIDFHAKLVADKFRRRELIRVLQEVQREAFNPASKWSDLISRSEELIFSLTDASQQAGLKPISEFLVDEMDRLDRITKGEECDTGIRTGFYDFDDFTKGLKRKKLYIIAGRPGMAKSSFAAAFAMNIAADGHPVAIFSLEMDGGEIVRRMLSAESSIDSMQIEAGEINSNEWDGLGKSFAKLSNLPIYIDESEDVTPSNVLSQCRFLKSRTGPLGAIVIDYLHLMLDGDDNEVKELGRITRACKKMSRALDVPVVLLSQLNRGVEAQANKRPSLASLRGSGSIEQDADMVAFLYRDEYYDPDTEEKGIAEIIISKNRGGKVGTVKLLFEPQFTRFRNLLTPGRSSHEPPAPKRQNVVQQKPYMPSYEAVTVEGFSVGDWVVTDYSEYDDQSRRELDASIPEGSTGQVLAVEEDRVLGETMIKVGLDQGAVRFAVDQIKRVNR